jgi:hypothetical protein
MSAPTRRAFDSWFARFSQRWNSDGSRKVYSIKLMKGGVNCMVERSSPAGGPQADRKLTAVLPP